MLFNQSRYLSTSQPSYAFSAFRGWLSEATSTTATSLPTDVKKTTQTRATNALFPPATPSPKVAPQVAPSQTSQFKVGLVSESEESTNIQCFLTTLQGLGMPNKLSHELQVQVDLLSKEAERIFELADSYSIRCSAGL
jgi:cell division septation protein DedD